MALQRGMPPNHPGEILKTLYIEPLSLTITKTAANLGVTRKALSEIVNAHTGISAEMAVRLSLAFNTTPDLWLNLQQEFDLWKAKKKITKSTIKPLVRKLARIA